jgi:GAF domain-containing protein
MNPDSQADPGVPPSSIAKPTPGIDPGVPTDHDDRDEDLTGSLAALSRLGSSRLSLEDLLTRVAGFAVQAIPGADGAGLTLLERDGSDTIVKSAPFVAEVDDIQYGLGEGPCISAAATGEVMRSGSLGGDRRWPRFGPRVSRLGVHSVLSLPLLTPDGVSGAMNVYAHAKDAFDDRAERLGQLFAVPAAIAVQNAQILAQTQRLASRLQAALVSRAVIDQAIGILMARSGITADEAFDRLRTLSQHEHTKLSAVATAIVATAVRRVRGRSAPDVPPES